MNKIHLQIIALTAVTACISVQAAAGEEAEGPWSGKIAAGYLAVNGNTESTTFTGNVEVNWDRDRWHHQLLGTALGKSENGGTTAEAYKAAYKGKFDLSNRTYIFGSLDYNKDRFSSYDKQIFETVGLGQRIIKTDRQELNVEIGGGATQSTLIEEPVPGTTVKTDVNEANYRVSADYKWKISDNATFSEKISVLSGSSNTYTESVTALSAGIIGALSTVLGYTIKHNSDVAPGKDKSDTFASISLEYVF